MIFSCNLFYLSDCDHQTELQTEVEGVADVGQQERRLGQRRDQHQPGEHGGGGHHYLYFRQKFLKSKNLNSS